MNKNPDVLIVGAGFAGLYAIHQFRRLGLTVQVLEAGTNVGGTWYWNRYPGARCDVPSLEYSYGFSEALEQEWSWPEVFSAQPDILRYANHVADRFHLREHIRFNTRVKSVVYQAEENTWCLESEQGDVFTATYCVMATGCLSVPNTPSLPGAGTFAGLVLHTGRWPKEAVNLSGKRVGIIGTGSSGVQAIPELAKQAGYLTVFQRTPVYTVPANRKSMRPAVQQEFRDNYPQIREMQQHNAGGVSNFRPVKSVNRGSSSQPTPQASGAIGDTQNRLLDLTPEQRRTAIINGGLQVLLTYRDVYTDSKANEIANQLYRDAVTHMVDDPQVAEALLPKNYGLGCKRQVLDRDYYATFNQSNVHLVDVKRNPIANIEAGGIRLDVDDSTTTKDFHELDVLIYATGFDAMTGALLKANVQGRDGLKLAEKWQHGPEAYLGLQMRGFPNLFTVTGPGSPSVLCNMLVAIEQHVNWIGDCIKYLQRNDVHTIEPTVLAEQEWIAHVNEVADGTMYTTPSCNSWYLGANIPGKTRIFMPYVGGYPRYRDKCEQVAANGYQGFELRQRLESI